MSADTGSTAAAIAARRGQSKAKLDLVEKAIGQLRREGSRTTVRAIARRACVSPTFLYENPAARALVQAAAVAASDRRALAADSEHDKIEASWRERALNAEEALTHAQREVLAQRHHIGELMGQLRDLDQMVPGESVQRLLTESTTLKQRVHQLTREHRTLQERLEASRATNRFADRQIADLQAQLLDSRLQHG